MKNTKQKEAIITAVTSMRNHPTADEIYTELKKYYCKLSLGTVYRNLNTFASEGKIKKIPVPGYGDRFDFNIKEHEHMLCEKCGRVFDVDVEVSIKPGENMVEIKGYTLILNGICADCINALD